MLGAYRLPPDALLTSGKLVALDGLLRELKERGSRCALLLLVLFFCVLQHAFVCSLCCTIYAPPMPTPNPVQQHHQNNTITINNANSVLLFSQWTSVLDVMEWFLHERGLLYHRLDGSTNVADRLAICDAFNAPDSPAFAFLLSTRAGGQGLNLTGADTVVLHDVDFNPQVDKQAEDRCHRLGQTRKVTVYRLVCTGTVDADIYAIQQRKLRLDAAVLEGVTVSSADGGGAGPGADGGRGGAGGRFGGRGGRGGRGRGGVSAADARHMGAILAALLGGDEDDGGGGGGGGDQGAGAAGFGGAGAAAAGFGGAAAHGGLGSAGGSGAFDGVTGGSLSLGAPTPAASEPAGSEFAAVSEPAAA